MAMLVTDDMFVVSDAGTDVVAQVAAAPVLKLIRTVSNQLPLHLRSLGAHGGGAAARPHPLSAHAHRRDALAHGARPRRRRLALTLTRIRLLRLDPDLRARVVDPRVPISRLLLLIYDDVSHSHGE